MTEPPHRSWGARLAIGLCFVAVIIVGAVTFNSLYTSSNETPVVEIEKPTTENILPETANNTPQIQQQPVNPEAQPTPAKGAQFQVSDRGYTMSTNDLGRIMNINISVTNTGDAAGVPERMVLHLLRSDGVILMTWPMATRSMTNNNLIQPGSTYAFSAQLVEPPEGANILEVEIQ